MAEEKFTGLTSEQAAERLEKYGRNELTPQKKENFLLKVLHIASEPMFLLLLVAAVIYFLLGEPRDGAIMLIFVVGVIGIDVAQEWRTDKTLSALRELAAPRVRVLRDGEETDIDSALLVPGDVMLLSEGDKIPADGRILRCSDLSADESTLTGEAEAVWKTAEPDVGSDHWKKDVCYAGTLVVQGSAAVEVVATGRETEYGKIGVHVAEAQERETPLQAQTGKLVKACAVIAAVLFVLVALITMLGEAGQPWAQRIVSGILSGITLAMAMIPEEFPVILTVFLSMGAWRLAKKNSLVRRLPSVETLGAVSVLCVDKTGTITLNRMTVRDTWARGGDEERLVETMGLACETDTYDPMEKAMLDYCDNQGVSRGHLFGGEMLSEYAFTNKLKMMGHVWKHDGGIIIAAKGSPERIMTLCPMDEAQRAEAEQKAAEMSREGLRVIAVAIGRPAPDAIPAELTGCTLELCGLIGLADPPRDSVKRDIETCRRAGIRVVMITGDNGVTAYAIARAVGMDDGAVITGDELDAMSDEELRERAKTAAVFSRVVPEHKMRIVKALRENGEIVAMTGDGVNDAPALKSADIGIAMGKRGSEVSREAADLILMDDNFSTIVDTVRDGRRIYDNIKKAVAYVFAIHIPIALSSLLAPMLGVGADSLPLLPLHVVLLELLIDPTCSIVLERQPAERDVMSRRPRDPKQSLLSGGVLITGVLQGLAMFAASFGAYYYTLRTSGSADLARSMGLSVIMLSNMLLVQVNSSARDPMWRSIARLARDPIMWASSLVTLGGLLVILYTPLNSFLKLAPLSAGRFAAALGLAAASVLWFEIVKAVRRLKSRRASKKA